MHQIGADLQYYTIFRRKSYDPRNFTIHCTSRCVDLHDKCTGAHKREHKVAYTQWIWFITSSGMYFWVNCTLPLTTSLELLNEDIVNAFINQGRFSFSWNIIVKHRWGLDFGKDWNTPMMVYGCQLTYKTFSEVYIIFCQNDDKKSLVLRSMPKSWMLNGVA